MRQIDSHAVAAVTLLWQIATAVPASRQRRAPCLAAKVQLAFETAQSDCTEETAQKFDLKSGDDNGDPAAVSEDLYRLLHYFSSGPKPPTTIAPRADLIDSFKTCFIDKAAAATAATKSKNPVGDFNQKYMKEGILTLLDKVNQVDCKSKFAAVDVMKDTYVEEVRQKWEKLGWITRAFKTVLTKVTGWFNKEYVECFTKDKVMGATLPILMCVSTSDKESQAIFQKCLNDNLLPAPKMELEKKQEQRDKSMVHLGERWKAFIDAWICDKKSPRPKRSVKGAGKIMKYWPLSMLMGVLRGAYIVGLLAIMGFLFAGAPSCFVCAIPGAAIGAVIGIGSALCLLLYCFFGVPLRALGQLFSGDKEADDYDHTAAMEDVRKVAKYVTPGDI